MDVKSRILYEDNHLLALNKPAGVLVQGDRSGDLSLLDHAREYIRITYNKPGQAFLGLIHRLDRPVSGVVMMAKTSKALSRMTILFQQRKVRKYYYALCDKLPADESGRLIHWLKKNTKDNRTSVFKREVPQSKKSELEYRLKMMLRHKYLLEVMPITGRSHQIRAQLSCIGCTIIGDTKYGYRGKSTGVIALHARALHFEHPVKKEPLSVEAPVPVEPIWNGFAVSE